ncbi:MAG: DUF5106 domain-containing protein [Bacteroidales bacterium]|nr:DUF5106 domain-containing protein [Bacteroidales bacterium]
MRKNVILSLILISGLWMPAAAQKGQANNSKKTTGHELIFNVKNAPDHKMLLAIHFRDNLVVKDSAFATMPGKFIFKGDNSYDDGLYTLVSERKTPYLNFIIDKGQHFEYSLDTLGLSENFSVKNSEPNQVMLNFQRKNNEAQKKAQTWVEKIKAFETTNEKDSLTLYRQKMTDLNKEMVAFIDNMIAQYPNMLFSKMQKIYKQIDIPNAPEMLDKEEGLEWQRCYYRTHYWDNVDLTDGRLIFTPAFEPKMKDYFDKMLKYMEVDSIIRYTDILLEKSSHDSLMSRFMIDWTSRFFQEDQIMGHDAVFVHIVKNNQLKGKCPWMDEDLISRYEKRVTRLENILIGQPVPELVMHDTTMLDDARHMFSTHRMSKPYVILWFYDPNCHTCKTESGKLQKLYDSLETAGTRNFDVYSVAGNYDDINAWKKYVKEHNYKWTQVGGNVANYDYLTHFDLNGYPGMFIMDKEHKLIANRRIEIAAIPEYIQQWERMQQHIRERNEKEGK